MVLCKLFWAFFNVGLLSIGGGYAAMPLIQEQIVNVHKWLTVSEFADVVTIAEMTPGPIALNAASFVGMRVEGLAGAAAATVGCVVPSCIIVSVLAAIYNRYGNLKIINGALKGLRPAVVGMIAAAAYTILKMTLLSESVLNFFGINIISLIIFAASFICLRKYRCSPIIVMCAAGAAGLVLYCASEYIKLN